jgi:beta-hydroxylase
MILNPRLVLLALLGVFVLCVLLVHLRGRVRLRFDRQLVDHSAIFAPYNLLMYAFSAVPARPILDRRGFPQLDLLQANWQAIRDEATHLFDEGHIRAAEKHNDASFNSFFKQGWKRFYLKWYGEPLASAEALCPQTVALLKAIPSVKAAMFALLPPGSKLNPHRDPFAGSLRYHLGLITPNSRDCRIFVDGEEHAWGDGKDVVFDETYVHWAENNSAQTRVILFADVERPLRTRWMSAINRRVGAFMGKITASPNHASEKTGLLNRLFALGQRSRPGKSSFKAQFKRRHRKLYKGFKYASIILIIWLIFLAPWPFFR